MLKKLFCCHTYHKRYSHYASGIKYVAICYECTKCGKRLFIHEAR